MRTGSVWPVGLGSLLIALTPIWALEGESVPAQAYDIADETSLQSACQVVQNNATCQGLDLRLSISHLPRYLRALTVVNTSQLVIMPDSLRPLGGLAIYIEAVNLLVLGERALKIEDREAVVRFEVRNVPSAVQFPRQFVSARGGSFQLHLWNIRSVSIAAQAFDRLNQVQVNDVPHLLLREASFKPTQPSYGPRGSSFALVRVGLPVLPAQGFASTDSIAIVDSTIGEVGTNAFVGIQYQSVLFSGCEINRVQQGAFSEQTLINTLTFQSCQITSLAERSILSAVSTFVLEDSEVTSLGENALYSQAAKVVIRGNRFSTLSKKSLSFSSWSSVEISDNDIQFMDSGALLGLMSTNENKTFAFTGNSIAYANQGALELAGIDVENAHLDGIHFGRECDCEIATWLHLVCPNLGLTLEVLNVSSCQVRLNERQCLSSEKSAFPHYLSVMCQPEPTCIVPQSVFPALNIVDVYSNTGILLVLLIFALFVSLLLIIYTLLRRIIYYFQVRKYKRAEDDWNFTKITPKEPTETHCSDNYEELPLASPDTNIESGERESLIENAALPPRQTLPHQPLTFYDEVIDLLKDKLDDPDNYATVLNSCVPPEKNAPTPEMTLYQNPMEAATGDESPGATIEGSN